MSLFSFSFAKFPLWTLHVHRLLSGWNHTKSIKISPNVHRNWWSFTNPTRNIIQTFWPSRGEVQGQGLPVTKMDLPPWSQVTSFARICPNSISTFRSFSLGVENNTYSYSNHQHRSRADAWSGSGVYFAHVWTSQTWSNPKPEITTVTKSPPYLYSTKHHLISPHSKPQNNSTSPPVSSPQVHKAHGGSHTPYIKSTSSTTGEKNQLPPSRCLQLPHLVQGLARRGHRRSESRGKWGGLGPGSHPFCAFNAGENQRFAETWGPWIKSPLITGST